MSASTNFIDVIFHPQMGDNAGGFIESSPKREFTGIKTLRAFTIKQLNNYEVEEGSSVHRVDTAELTNLQIIGWVRQTKTTTTGSVFTVEDGTGSIECTFWPNGTWEEEICGFIEEDNLLKLVGSVRMFNNKKSVSVSNISKIEDYNFVTYHFMNAIYQHLHYTGRLVREEAPVQAKFSNKFSKIKCDILECYRNNQDESGLHLDIVVKMLGNKYSEDDIRSNVATLLSDAHLYSVDGLEYKTPF